LVDRAIRSLVLVHLPRNVCVVWHPIRQVITAKLAGLARTFT
jgi:hypothetical protein